MFCFSLYYMSYYKEVLWNNSNWELNSLDVFPPGSNSWYCCPQNMCSNECTYYTCVEGRGRRPETPQCQEAVQLHGAWVSNHILSTSGTLPSCALLLISSICSAAPGICVAFAFWFCCQWACVASASTGAMPTAFGCPQGTAGSSRSSCRPSCNAGLLHLTLAQPQ